MQVKGTLQPLKPWVCSRSELKGWQALLLWIPCFKSLLRLATERKQSAQGCNRSTYGEAACLFALHCTWANLNQSLVGNLTSSWWLKNSVTQRLGMVWAPFQFLHHKFTTMFCSSWEMHQQARTAGATLTEVSPFPPADILVFLLESVLDKAGRFTRVRTDLI